MAPRPDVAEQELLRYVTDAAPGITRRKRGNSFAYFDPQGRRITDAPVLDRVRHYTILADSRHLASALEDRNPRGGATSAAIPRYRLAG